MKRTGKDIHCACEGLVDFKAHECSGVAEGVDNFDWLPDQFDAIFCGVENGMMVFQYGEIRMMTPVRDETNKLRHGDLVTMKVR
jgi:hypothetical protein